MSQAKYFRKVIRIRATDSPNVRYALAQKAAGLPITNDILVPGVITYEEYRYRELTWDKIKKRVGLEAEFYEGEENLLYPPLWLDNSAKIAELLKVQIPIRRAKSIGIDPAEGGDKTSICVIDEFGILELTSSLTPDTSVIPNLVLGLMLRYGVPASKVAFDRGGGGKQHADTLRSRGYKVRTVAFGESVSLDPRQGTNQLKARIEVKEDKYVYKNRRAEMFGELRYAIQPSNSIVFAIPAEYTNLRQELAPIPFTYDPEGRLVLPPKNAKPGDSKDEITLTKLIGHSPDEADALVLAYHAMTHKANIAQTEVF